MGKCNKMVPARRSTLFHPEKGTSKSPQKKMGEPWADCKDSGFALVVPGQLPVDLKFQRGIVRGLPCGAMGEGYPWRSPGAQDELFTRPGSHARLPTALLGPAWVRTFPLTTTAPRFSPTAFLWPCLSLGDPPKWGFPFGFDFKPPNWVASKKRKKTKPPWSL